MKKLVFGLVALSFVSCESNISTKRIPSSIEALDTQIEKAESRVDNLKSLRDSSSSEVFVDFSKSGSIGKGRYIIQAEVFSNDLKGIESASIDISEDKVWDIKLIIKEDKVLIDEVVPFKLPISTTTLKFNFKESDSKRVELYCTIPDKC
jgi:hypothetical protein